MWIRIAAICLLVLAAGCLHDDDRDEFPRWGNIWPHDDGLLWLYDYSVAVYDNGFDVFETVNEVPGVPPMSVLAAYLDTALPDTVGIDFGYYELLFDGDITTTGGVTAQQMVESLYDLDFQFPVSGPLNGEQQRLLHIAAARPDLKPAISKAHPKLPLPVPGQTLTVPLLLAGGPWEQNDEWIGNYNDFEDTLSWKYLYEDLEPRTTFRFQLSPFLADDIFADVEILDWEDLETPVGTFRNCVPALYRVDFGIVEVLGLDGESRGYFRPFAYGLIFYAPGIGPVYSLERNLVNVTNPLEVGTEIEAILVSHHLRD